MVEQKVWELADSTSCTHREVAHTQTDRNKGKLWWVQGHCALSGPWTLIMHHGWSVWLIALWVREKNPSGVSGPRLGGPSSHNTCNSAAALDAKPHLSLPLQWEGSIAGPHPETGEGHKEERERERCKTPEKRVAVCHARLNSKKVQIYFFMLFESILSGQNLHIGKSTRISNYAI